MVTLTWYRPAKPGVRPANSGLTMVPPIPPPKLTVGVVATRAKGSLDGAAFPVATIGLVDPNPIAQSVNVSPALAGWVATPGQDPSGMGRLPSRLVMTPYRPTPPSRMRGARGTISTDTRLLACPSVRFTWMVEVPVGASVGI